ncbi:uncharacterized protein [Macaca nemestrina]|uniref:uncharacterized protein n=1 Tax=Macaca nemestrina TaxID=9545 RepID=UPI0039B91115
MTEGSRLSGAKDLALRGAVTVGSSWGRGTIHDREASGSVEDSQEPVGVWLDAGSSRVYVLEGDGKTGPGIHLTARRRPRLDRPGGRGGGVERAEMVGGSPGDPSSLRSPPRQPAPTCSPLCDRESFRACGSWRGRPCPACVYAHHRVRHCPGGRAARRQPPAALTRNSVGRGALGADAGREDAPGHRAPVRRRHGHLVRVLGPGGEGGAQRAARELAQEGQLALQVESVPHPVSGKSPGGSSLMRTEGEVHLPRPWRPASSLSLISS